MRTHHVRLWHLIKVGLIALPRSQAMDPKKGNDYGADWLAVSMYVHVKLIRKLRVDCHRSCTIALNHTFLYIYTERAVQHADMIRH